ncbi:MAG: rRNA maturation RNase YbeY [Myxococcota bacterium]
MPPVVATALENLDTNPYPSLSEDARILLGAYELPEDVELSIVLCDDAFITSLNASYRGKPHPTDVLSFAQREGDGAFADDPILGDVIISVETAARQADANQISLQEELQVLLVHGLLHLLGHDHLSDAERDEMEQEERALLGTLGADVERVRPLTAPDRRAADG